MGIRRRCWHRRQLVAETRETGASHRVDERPEPAAAATCRSAAVEASASLLNDRIIWDFLGGGHFSRLPTYPIVRMPSSKNNASFTSEHAMSMVRY